MTMMRLFSRKKEAKKQLDTAINKQLEKSCDTTNNARALKTPTEDSKHRPTSAVLNDNTSQNQLYLTKATRSAATPTSKQRNQPTSVTDKQSQFPSSPLSNTEAHPTSNNIPARNKQKHAVKDSNHERNKSIGTTAPDNIRPINTPVKPPPRSILHTHHEHTQQHATFAMDTPEAIPPQNRVRFLSSNSSVASSSCASEVHLMAGPGSVASSSAMSSSKGEGENVFDRVLHSVMAEEEDRLKAMGMSKAGSSTLLSPAMYYKSSESPGMYYRGGNRGVTSSGSDELSPQTKSSVKIAAAGHLIDMDTGMRINTSLTSGNIECEYHDLHDDDAIDTNKYMTLLSDVSGGNHSKLNESMASGDSDRAVNGSMTSYSRATESNQGSQSYDTEQQKPRTQSLQKRY